MRALNYVFVTLLMLLAAAWSGVATAQAPLGLGARTSHIRATLLAESAEPKPGGTVTLAIHMVPEAGWHGYWINPGDAGLALEPTWQLPQGATVGALRYPAPGRLLVSGLMNHVYEGPYALLAELRMPANAKPGAALPIRLAAQWLACTDKICVPEQATLSLDLTAGTGNIQSEDRTRFDGFRAGLPRPLGSEAHFALKGDRLSIAIPYPASAPIKDPWFFAATKDVVRYAEPQRFRRDDDMLIVETGGRAPTEHAIEGVLTVAPGVALSLTARPGPVPAGGMALGSSTAATPAFGLAAFALALGGALLGGLILNVMPCVFPILSLKAIALSRAGGDEREARVEALAYTAGIVLSCLALGGFILALRGAGHSVGWAFQLQDPRVIALLLILVTAITLNLAGLFELSALDAGRQGSGARGAFLTGILAAFVATPCTGPFMAAAMGAALVMPWPLALTIFAGLGLGLALPFLALAFVPALRTRLPKPGRWMARLRHLMAVPMGLTGLALGWLLWRQAGEGGVLLAVALAALTALFGLLAGRMQRRGRQVGMAALAGTIVLVTLPLAIPLGSASPSRAAVIKDAMPFSEKELAALRSAGSPVFLYFTADWCVTCKVNEAAAISDGAVRRHFEQQGIRIMEGDWTNGDPAITRFLEAHGRSGVPLYLYYAAGASEPQVLPQILTPGTLTALQGR
jgi:thiol:disulfide interchange protein